jgi:GNAT superfamily N-acetyltransferase
MSYHSTSLTADHELDSFDCGVESLDTWLRTDAMRAQRADTARTYVWTESPDDVEVLAYFSFAPTRVAREELTSGQAGGQSGWIPAYLIARLALDKRKHRQGLGVELLVDAIGRLAGASQVTAGRLIVVDAIDDDAAAFYAKYNFQAVKKTPRQLVLKMATARKIMGIED